MQPNDYSSIFQYTQPVAAGSTWMPQTKQIMFPYASQTMGPADYSLAPGSPTGFSLGNAPIAQPTLDAMGAGSMPVTSAPPAALSWMRESGFLGDRNNQGWGGLALGAAQGAAGMLLGLQQYNLAKETLANNKAQFERNFAAQRTTLNANMEDRQRARVASNAGAYQSVGDYMAQNGVR